MSPYLSMLGGCVAFAFMGALVHALGSRCDWQVIALARTGLALVFGILLARIADVKLVFRRPRTLWLRSIAGSISLVCTFYALTVLPVPDVLTLTNMFPIWVALLSWPMLRERPSPWVWLSAVCGIIGVILIQHPHFEAGNLATMLAIVASGATAFAMIGLNRLQQIDVRAIVVHFSLVSLVFCVIALVIFDRPHETEFVFAGTSLWMLLGVGVTATIGQIFLTKAFAAGVPAKVSVVSLSQIVIAMFLDVLLWDRSFDPETLLGMGLVVAPTAWLMTCRA